MDKHHHYGKSWMEASRLKAASAKKLAAAREEAARLKAQMEAEDVSFMAAHITATNVHTSMYGSCGIHVITLED